MQITTLVGEWFWREFQEKTFEDIRTKNLQGSRRAWLVEMFTSRFEHVGILVEYGFLNQEQFF